MFILMIMISINIIIMLSFFLIFFFSIGMDLYFTRINNTTDKMITIFKEIYDMKGAPQGRNLVVLQLGQEAAYFAPVIGDSIVSSITSSRRARGPPKY